jgi:hypothetical protein
MRRAIVIADLRALPLPEVPRLVAHLDHRVVALDLHVLPTLAGPRRLAGERRAAGEQAGDEQRRKHLDHQHSVRHGLTPSGRLAG